MLSKNFETAQRRNFTLYLETGRNANVYSRLISTVTTGYYYASGRERDSGRLYESGYKKNSEKKALN